jgi:hypothetical protein
MLRKVKEAVQEMMDNKKMIIKDRPTTRDSRLRRRVRLSEEDDDLREEPSFFLTTRFWYMKLQNHHQDQFRQNS